MALKKSELYSSIWAMCNELRGGMDASQYKDYVLALLFVKYISDKYAGKPYAPITVPNGASFKDMVALKGNPNIGDYINKRILGKIVDANRLSNIMPDFADETKLGSGKEMVDRLTNLIAIFEDKALDFSNNRADGDDLLGDAYEYLMRHFATESGKSKGQFYTPAEVSRIIAKVIGINDKNTNASTTAYDPTCGSGSLLLKVASETRKKISLYGQEKDIATSGLAKMNMILHDNPMAEIKQGNTLANPLFLDDNGNLKTFDYVVANPPFSDKSWGNGVDPLNDSHGRFKEFGIPPAKNGDYAYLLHIIRSLKSKGKGVCILPHGVLFRGNSEAEIREKLVKKGYIKGIIGLPPNLFYGTGIPACIIVLDKENAESRKGIFMIDASKGFMKDGNKNRLREMDIHKIVDLFNNQIEIDKFSRMAYYSDIKKNEYNLNLPRYIDTQEPEDIQDIEAHLQGGIPSRDIDELNSYWEVCPSLRKALFKKSDRPGYGILKVDKDVIRQTIYEYPEFIAYKESMDSLFSKWKKKTSNNLKSIDKGIKPRELITQLSEELLSHYTDKPLIDRYDIYQYLMDYWNETMQDDCYFISADGWKVEISRIIEKDNKGKEKDKGWTCELIPKELVINRYFYKESEKLENLGSEVELLESQIAEIEEEQNTEEGYFFGLEKVNKGNINARLKEIKNDNEAKDEITVLTHYLTLTEKLADCNKKIKTENADLDKKLLDRYPKLTAEEIKILVVDDKWLAKIEKDIHSEIDKISQRLTTRVKELAERYETPLPELTLELKELEKKVSKHLERMGFVWK